MGKEKRLMDDSRFSGGIGVTAKMKIYVCIGSSCHLKGSYDIIAVLKKLVSDRGLEKEVSLNASFCLGHCMDGVTIKIDDQLITGVTPRTSPRFLTGPGRSGILPDRSQQNRMFRSKGGTTSARR